MKQITKIEIITNQSKFEELKEALNEIGITGITVFNILGCGAQKGKREVYRGQECDIDLLPKIKLEIVVCSVPVQSVVDVALKVLRTGKIGDGKIFIHPIENVIRVRTGEQGPDAV